MYIAAAPPPCGVSSEVSFVVNAIQTHTRSCRRFRGLDAFLLVLASVLFDMKFWSKHSGVSRAGPHGLFGEMSRFPEVRAPSASCCVCIAMLCNMIVGPWSVRHKFRLQHQARPAVCSNACMQFYARAHDRVCISIILVV